MGFCLGRGLTSLRETWRGFLTPLLVCVCVCVCLCVSPHKKFGVRSVFFLGVWWCGVGGVCVWVCVGVCAGVCGWWWCVCGGGGQRFWSGKGGGGQTN